MAFGWSPIERMAIAFAGARGLDWVALTPAERLSCIEGARAAMLALRPFARMLAETLPPEPSLLDLSVYPKDQILAQAFSQMINAALREGPQAD